MAHVPLQPGPRLTAFRRISLGTWRTARDPTVYGSVTLNMDAAVAYLEAARRASGDRITVTHLFAKAVAEMLVACPDVNVLRRFGRLYRRGDNVVVFQVAMQDPETGAVDLSAHASRDGHRKSLLQIADEFAAATERIRTARDPELERARRMMKRLPSWLAGRAVETLSTLMYDLNLDLSMLGLPRSPFGPVTVTNVGSLGVEEAYVPLVPYTRAHLNVALGALRKEPVVTGDGKVGVAWTMRLMASFDHRVLDGAHASRMIEVVRAWLEQPQAHFGDPAEWGAAKPDGDTPRVADAAG
jgi:pyruvate dehydrogenase E2 component (dihydrolipoamide acetyltransferase)